MENFSEQEMEKEIEVEVAETSVDTESVIEEITQPEESTNIESESESEGEINVDTEIQTESDLEPEDELETIEEQSPEDAPIEIIEQVSDTVGPEEAHVDSNHDIEFEEVDENKVEASMITSIEEHPLVELEAEIKQKITDLSTSTNGDSAEVKKYVIYIDADNVDFMEELSVEERRKLINDIVKEQSKLSSVEIERLKRKRFFKHAITAALTFVIGFPLFFLCVNKATEATINNYKAAKNNFVKLYREKGKIKAIENQNIEGLKY